MWWWRTTEERQRDEQAQATVRTFAKAWQDRAFDKATLRFAGTTPDAVAKDFSTATSGLGTGPLSVSVDSVRRNGNTATADLEVTWTLPGSVPWSYRTSVDVGETAGAGPCSRLPTAPSGTRSSPRRRP